MVPNKPLHSTPRCRLCSMVWLIGRARVSFQRSAMKAVISMALSIRGVTLASLFLSVTVGLGQGEVQFRTRVSYTQPPVDGRIYVNGTPVDGSDPLFRAALIGGPFDTGIPTSVDALGNLQTMYSPRVTTITWAHFYTGATPNLTGYVNASPYWSRVVPGADWGGWAMVQVVAWHGNYDTWPEAWAAAHLDSNVLIGFSDPLHVLLPSEPLSPVYAYPWGLQPFSLQPIPEPSVLGLFALAGLTALVSGKSRTKGLNR